MHLIDAFFTVLAEYFSLNVLALSREPVVIGELIKLAQAEDCKCGTGKSMHNQQARMLADSRDFLASCMV